MCKIFSQNQSISVKSFSVKHFDFPLFRVASSLSCSSKSWLANVTVLILIFFASVKIIHPPESASGRNCHPVRKYIVSGSNANASLKAPLKGCEKPSAHSPRLIIVKLADELFLNIGRHLLKCWENRGCLLQKPLPTPNSCSGFKFPTDKITSFFENGNISNNRPEWSRM